MRCRDRKRKRGERGKKEEGTGRVEKEGERKGKKGTPCVFLNLQNSLCGVNVCVQQKVKNTQN